MDMTLLLQRLPQRPVQATDGPDCIRFTISDTWTSG